MLIVALLLAALIHIKETWLLVHGFSYLLGFPAMQILLPIYGRALLGTKYWSRSCPVTQRSVPLPHSPATHACVGVPREYRTC